MYRVLILLLLSLLSHESILAQKFGYVDMEYINSKLPEYAKAQAEIDKLSENWAREIQERLSAIDGMQRALMAEEVLLTDEMKRKRQEEIREKELETREYNNKVFGPYGHLFQKKKELMNEVMERVQAAVYKVAAQRKLDFLFDKSSDMGMIYTSPKHDYTDYVLEELGIDLKPSASSAVQGPVQQNPAAVGRQAPANSTAKPGPGRQ